MTSSATTFRLSKPTGRDRISGATLSYMQTRNRMRAFNLVHSELRKSGLSKAELADRTGKGADRIAHLLGAPGNWTLDTVSDLLFAISGGEVDYQISYPLDKNARNRNVPSWLFPDVTQPINPKETLPPTVIGMSSVSEVRLSPLPFTYLGTSSDSKNINVSFDPVAA